MRLHILNNDTQQPSRVNVQLTVQKLYSCFGSTSPLADSFKYNSGQRGSFQIMQEFALKKTAGQTRLAGFSPSMQAANCAPRGIYYLHDTFLQLTPDI